MVEAAPIEGHFFHVGLFTPCTARRIHRIAHGRARLDCYALVDRANLQPEVLINVILNIDNEAKQIYLLKSLLLDTDLVLARLNVWKNIDTRIVRSRGCDRPTLGTLKPHFRSRHGGSCPICDQPRNRSGLSLSHDSTGKPYDDE